MEAEVLTNTEVAERNEGWYRQMIDDCAQNLTEAMACSKWTVIVAWHAVGSRILSEKDGFERKKLYGEKICDTVAKSLGVNRTYVYRAVSFAQKFPDLNMFPGDKSLSWHKVCQRYLGVQEGEKEKKPKVCPSCGFDLSKKKD